MRNAPIVPGVPTPYFYQNRVYPSRFHGGIWTRPVFGFPKIARPQDVFTPGYDINAQVPQPTLSGLGATVGELLWQTGEGIFKPGGYGGGVFDGDISGLGSLTNVKRKKRRTLRGLGDDTADYPWRAVSEKTRALQTATNESLAKAGMCPIAVDGKLGPGTCGARDWLNANNKEGLTFYNPDACDAHREEYVRPATKASGCGAGTSTQAPASPVVVEAGMSSSTKRVLGFALGGVLAIGAVALLRRK